MACCEASNLESPASWSLGASSLVIGFENPLAEAVFGARGYSSSGERDGLPRGEGGSPRRLAMASAPAQSGAAAPAARKDLDSR
jgi:hypothetical protein